MLTRPFVGVRGITDDAQFQELYTIRAGQAMYDLMIGLRWPRTHTSDILGVLSAMGKREGLLRTLCCEEADIELSDLKRTHYSCDRAGFEAIELSQPWPSSSMINEYRRLHRFGKKLILRIGDVAWRRVAEDQEQFATRLLEYGRTVDAVVIDLTDMGLSKGNLYQLLQGIGNAGMSPIVEGSLGQELSLSTLSDGVRNDAASEGGGVELSTLMTWQDKEKTLAEFTGHLRALTGQHA